MKDTRKPNREERLRERVANHVRHAGRKAQKGVEPNDRKYDPDFQNSLRRMSPEELDALMHRDERDD
jgi:hypothetical protein